VYLIEKGPSAMYPGKSMFILATGAALVLLPHCGLQGQDVHWRTLVGSATRLARLESKPPCLESFSRSETTYVVERVAVRSEGVELAALLYLPPGKGRFPGVVFMHGGGNDVDQLRAAPLFYAPRLAHCGFAVLTYDKRGTGDSKGVFGECTLDDFITDAGNAALFLARDPRVDSTRIALYGGSEGGRLAPVVAVRFPLLSAVITVSGPIGTNADQANYNMRFALSSRGYVDSVIAQVMPLWKRNHAAWTSRDPAEFKAVAAEIRQMRKQYDTFALPSTREEMMTDEKLSFLRPGYVSMWRDYTAELKDLRIPWLAVFGQQDPIVDVRESAAYIKKMAQVSGNKQCEVFVVEDVGHSLSKSTERKRVMMEWVLINWLGEKWGR